MRKYYIQLFSPHGLIRSDNPEIGKDKDTGGQVKYVLELLQALSTHENVRKIDLFTRRIEHRRVAPSYAKEIDVVNEKARIIRIQCGGKAYRKKETLWNYLDEFIDKTIRFNTEQDDIPDLVHGHYADGNYIAGQLSKMFEIPFFSTGHSLGRNKQKILVEHGMSLTEISKRFNIDKRISAEEETISAADLIITSTQYEIESQYRHYNAFKDANFEVIPPGINKNIFYPYYRQNMPSFNLPLEEEQAIHRINTEIERFLLDPGKPLILSIGRPDKRKNFETIIKAYGEDKELQTMANLAIFAGVRTDITQLPEEEQEIWTQLLLLIDKYDLYGKIAIPKRNDPKLEIPEIYRLAARTKGVFINATPGENFGLTILEAMACGLPVIASPTGGPKEILEKCNSGILTNVEKPVAIADSIKNIIGNSETWNSYSVNGIRGIQEYYSWEAHILKYVTSIQHLESDVQIDTIQKRNVNIGRRLSGANTFLISDLDGIFVSERNEDKIDVFKKWIESNRNEVVFGIATGRNPQLTKQALKELNLPQPDILFCSAGSELYYTKDFIPDSGWESYISYLWNREKLEKSLYKFPKISLQEPDAQWRFKLSYYVDPDFNENDLTDLYKWLDDNRIKVNIRFTDNTYLDLLPYRASQKIAMKYLSYKWTAPLDKFITDSNEGNKMNVIKRKLKGLIVTY